jgi:hypothetical protein
VGIKRFSETARVLKHTIDKFVQMTTEVWKDFNQEARLYNSSGEDSVPCKDDQLILVKIDGTGKYIAVGVLTVTQGAKPGEKILYARDADAKIVSKISMLNDGSINLNTDFEGDGHYTKNIKGDDSETVKGTKSETVEKAVTQTYKDTMDVAVDKAYTLDGKDDITLKSGKDMSAEATGKNTLKGQSVLLDGQTGVQLKTPDSAAWCPNAVPVCPFGMPHGGPGAGIVMLKG